MNRSDQPRFETAEYKDLGLPEHVCNPLIAALPEIMSRVRAFEALTKRPTFQREEINLAGHIRVHAINRMTPGLLRSPIVAHFTGTENLSDDQKQLLRQEPQNSSVQTNVEFNQRHVAETGSDFLCA